MRKNQKRLNVNLPESVYEEIKDLARKWRMNLTELFRLAFALVYIAYQEKWAGNKLVILNKRGKVLREIVVP